MMGMNLGSIVAYLKMDMSNWNNNLNRAYDDSVKLQKNLRGITNVGKTMASVGKSLTVGVTVPLAGMATAAVKSGMAFEQSMANVRSLMGLTAKETENLSNKLIEAGTGTIFTAKDTADAVSYMALAGWDATKSLKALPDVLNLATAGELELQHASDLVTDYLSAFGMQANESARFVDVLTKAQSTSNTTVEGLGNAFKRCAANANAFGMSVEEASAILGLMANQGLKAQESGTALNAIIRDMTQKMKNGSIEIGNHKVAVQDANKNFRGMADIIADIEKVTGGMGTAQKQAALMTTFTSDSIQGLNVVMGAGSEELKKYTETLENSYGEGATQAGVKSDTLQGAISRLRGELSRLSGDLFSMGKGPLTTFIDKLADLIIYFRELPDGVQQAILLVGGFVAAVGPVTWVIGSIIKSINSIVKVGKFLLGGVSKLSFLTQPLTWIFSKLWGILLANPITLVIGAILLLVGAFVYAWNKIDGFKEFWQRVWQDIVDDATAVGAFFTETIPQWFGKIGEWFAKLDGDVNFWLVNMIGEFGEWCWNMITKAVDAGGQFVTGFLTWIITLPVRFLAVLMELIASIVEWIAILLGKGVDAGSKFVSGVIGVVTGLPSKVGGFLQSVITRVGKWASDMGIKGAEGAAKFANKIIDGISKLPQRVGDIGKSICQGLARGIENGIDWVKDSARRVANSALNTMKGLLKINSPSKVFRDKIGIAIPEGLGKGITKYRKYALDAITSLSNDIVEGFNPDLTNSLTMSASVKGSETPQTQLTSQLKQLNDKLMTGSLIDYGKMENAFVRGAEMVDTPIFMDKTLVGGKTAPTVKRANDAVRKRLNRLEGVME